MSINHEELAERLCKAVNVGDPRQVEALLVQGADPSLVLQKGAAAVHLASGKETEKRIRCLRLLLQHGADPNVRSVDDLTPLHIAALWGCYQNLKLLLQNGGDPSLKDQDGNRAADLAKQQDNRKCAQLLQEYQSYSLLQPEKEDLLRYEYSFYDGETSRDSFAIGDNCTSMSHNLSLLSDCGDGPLSSTRRSLHDSSCLNLSAISTRPSWGGGCRLSGQPDFSQLRGPFSQDWSRTRISTAGGRALGEILPALQEHVPLSACSLQPRDGELCSFPEGFSESPSRSPELVDTPVCANRRASRKSVSFKQANEYFPASAPTSPLRPAAEESRPMADVTFDPSEYPEFLDADRLANVLSSQGIDVTSPDHVFVFSRGSDSAGADLDKTQVGFWPSAGDEEALRAMLNAWMLSSKIPLREHGAGVQEGIADATSADQTEVARHSCPGEGDEPTRDVLISSRLCSAGKALPAAEEERPLVPSPFVTGRTKSRQSRCFLRTNSSSSASPSSSSLFDDTLPIPVRLCRRNPKRHDGSAAAKGSPRSCSVTDGKEDSLLVTARQSTQDCQTNTPLDERPRPTGRCQRQQSCMTSDLDSSNPQVKHTLSTEKQMAFLSSHKSPETQRRPPLTPGSGYTPRYSISRLSARHQAERLADLSYTPGGRPLMVDADEPIEYLYTDTEQGHTLIECHVPPTANSTLISSEAECDTTTSEDTVLYNWRSFQASPAKDKENRLPQNEVSAEIRGLSDRELRRRLKELGEDPGPINKTTRPLYLQQLNRLKSDSCVRQPKNNPGYSPELAISLHTFQLPKCHADELALCQQFDQPDQNRKWREGVVKSSFNYLLLDPRSLQKACVVPMVTKNLPARSPSLSPAECFRVFVSAIFYVGKGKRSRPYSHLYEALDYYRGDKTSKKLCSKVQHILQVWATGQGVISLHCFQNVIPVEAYTREACMVDAIGLKMLTNQKRGDYYGVVATWPMKRRRDLGVRLLHRTMQIFLAEGERQLRPADLRVGR
ncbi:ANKL1 protein, partial [Atractosteus spatula]|nr:ANKL1 protein [Atractosteus spatula]